MIFLCYGGYKGTRGEKLVSVLRGGIDTAIVRFVESQSRARFDCAICSSGEEAFAILMR